MATKPTDLQPGLIRLSLAARIAGLSPEMMEAASKRGDIAVRVERIGLNATRYVRVNELASFLGVPNLDLI
jgi:hypothetical protein